MYFQSFSRFLFVLFTSICLHINITINYIIDIFMKMLYNKMGPTMFFEKFNFILIGSSFLGVFFFFFFLSFFYII